MNTRATLCLLALTATALPQTTLKPPDLFWFVDSRPLTPERMDQMTPVLKQFEAAHVFDAFALTIWPPTLTSYDSKREVEFINSMNTALHGKVMAVTVPVGTEGWETSGNTRVAQHTGATYDPSKAITDKQWLETLAITKANTWAWILEQPAGMPTPEQASAASSRFTAFAKAKDRKTVVWLSAEALNVPRYLPMLQKICGDNKDNADYFAWMDLPPMIQKKALGHPAKSPEEGHMTPAMLRELDLLLDALLAISPPAKTVIQFENFPNAPTGTVEGTTSYMAACQRKGVNKFVLLSAANGLQREPWHSFYLTLAKRP